MDLLQEARDEIRSVDSQMAELFERRMRAAEKVAEYKKSVGIPVLDSAQEERVIRRNVAMLEDVVLHPYYISFIQNMMAVSRSYQERLISGVKVAYNGVEGAFAHIAAKRIFPQATWVSYPSFEAAYQAVENGECDNAVLPTENSYAGEVAQVTDLMFNGSLFVNGLYDLPITEHLLGIPGSRAEEVETVLSHPQALWQCHTYIQSHDFKEITTSSTASAALRVAEEKNPRLAAIASMETAELYGLEVLDHDINESKTNTTRFAVFSRARHIPAGKVENRSFILLFTVNHVAGALAKALNVIGECGFNMRALRSRPAKTESWSYYFYIEAEGDETSPEGQKMLAELKELCPKIKVVGSFQAGKKL